MRCMASTQKRLWISWAPSHVASFSLYTIGSTKLSEWPPTSQQTLKYRTYGVWRRFYTAAYECLALSDGLEMELKSLVWWTTTRLCWKKDFFSVRLKTSFERLSFSFSFETVLLAIPPFFVFLLYKQAHQKNADGQGRQGFRRAPMLHIHFFKVTLMLYHSVSKLIVLKSKLSTSITSLLKVSG